MGIKDCLPKCGKSSCKKSEAAPQLIPTTVSKTCTRCRTAQAVPADATVFVCFSCHAVNRLTSDVAVETADDTMPTLIALRRVNSSTFVPLESAPEAKTDVSTTPQLHSELASVNSIGACSICLDAPGDMIFQDCNHGGFCEACSRHIAGNNAVGGAFCVKCRSPIKRVVRIVELDNDVVKAVCVEVQTDSASINKQPPKVPPPRGLNKAKKR
jgi:hypothetical protein